jgi:hypothetical protein
MAQAAAYPVTEETMTDLAGAVPPNGQNARLDKLLRKMEDRDKVDWWVRIAPFAAIFVAAALSYLAWTGQQFSTKSSATADLANANAAAVIQLKENLIALRAEMKESVAAFRVEMKNTADRLDMGKADRQASEREQANQIGALKEGQARFEANQKNQTQMIERLMRKLEEVRNDGSLPFNRNQGLKGFDLFLNPFPILTTVLDASR